MDDEAVFVNEKVEEIVKNKIDEVLGEDYYVEEKVPDWIDAICAGVVEDLVGLGKPFKYIVHCAIVQDIGAGVHTAHSLHCDGVNDGVAVIKWPADKSRAESAHMVAVVTVFGMALFIK